MDPGSAVAAAAAAATAGALARAAQKQAAAAKAAEGEPMVELDLQAGRVKPRGDDAAAAEQAAAPAAPAPAAPAPAAPAPAPGSTARFFVRGVSTLGEHHLKDHFEKFGQVLEASHVRDKKTQRPRGIAFVTLAPRLPKEGEEPMTLDALVEKVMAASHKVKDAELDLQEAMAKPEKEEAETEGDQSPTAGGAAPTGASAAAAAQEPEQAPMDPAAQANAQAQWQMHYLALAINASVPEVPTTPSKPQPSGAVPKAAGFQAAPRNGGKGHGKGRTPY